MNTPIFCESNYPCLKQEIPVFYSWEMSLVSPSKQVKL